MGIVLPQVVTEDRASGGQVIDSSLKFDDSFKTNLGRTPGSVGNRKIFTWSGWTKRSQIGDTQRLMFVGDGSNYFSISFNNDTVQVEEAGGSYAFYVYTNAVFRDTGWYHVAIAVDTTQSTESNRVKVYVNGVDQGLTAGNNWPPLNAELQINNTVDHRIGRNDADCFNGLLTNTYLIDGQALGPENFGFTDGLTNTWRPKKYTGTFGTNGFYLRMDGNSPIGEDKSGNGNDFTPVNFGGSVALPKATGAKPILNTTQGGTQAGVGVFGSRENIGYAVTVAPKTGGGNAYYIDGVERQTLTGLIRGATYTFDQSDSSNDNHPLRLSITDDGTHTGGGVQYTDGNVQGGTPGTAGAATTITIPYNAPNTLYYYCGNHSGMGNNITGITTNEKLADQYASNCVLALPLLSSANDVSTSIGCTSTTKTTAVTNAVASNNASNFYSGSYYFDGSGDFINVTAQSELSLQGDFTVECWTFIDTNVSNGKQISSLGYYVSGKDGNWYFGLSSAAGYEIVFYSYDGQSSAEFVNADLDAPQIDKWYHIAAVRIGTTVTLYVDGVSKASGTISKGLDNGGVDGLTLGRLSQSGGSGAYGTLNGYIQDLRIYNGVGKYTSNFIPASTNPDILPDTPSGVSGSSKLAKVTDGAVTFDGTDDYLNVDWSSDFEFSTGDFTIEYYGYWNTSGTSIAWGQSLSERFDLGSLSAGSVRFFCRSNSSTFINISADIAPSKWSHIAAVREGTAFRLYIDGKLGASGTASDTMPNDSSRGVDIGRRRYSSTDSTYTNGSISNLRVIKGTALYTSNFTPPTEPLTNVTNTKLLCCQSNTSATEGAVKPGTITANGDAAATNFNPFNTDIHTVRGQETGYATLDSLAPDNGAILSDGNLETTFTTGSSTGTVPGTIFVDNSKWYCEVTIEDIGGSSEAQIGIIREDDRTNRYIGATGTNGYGYEPYRDRKYGPNAANSTGIFGTTYTSGTHHYAMALDLDEGTLDIYKEGILQGELQNGISGRYTFAVADIGGADVPVIKVNFGQKPFKFPPPDGFQPLNSASATPETVIARPDQYVGIVTYTGNGTARRISGYNFQPDLVWCKLRGTSGDNILQDTVRGTGVYIRSNSTGGDVSDSNYITNFNRDGFSVGTANPVNQNNQGIVAWCWKAGGNKNTFNKDDVGYASAAAAGLTAGDIAPTGASVGTKQGFSIIKWVSIAWAGNANNRQVPHGLTQAPDFIVTKGMETTGGWYTYHKDLHATDPNDYYMTLNTNDAVGNLADSFGPNKPDATTFGDRLLGMEAGKDSIAYVWHDVPGLQKFGSYEGNGDNDGAYIELGFTPKVLLTKSSSHGSDWQLWDTSRQPHNVNANTLTPNSSAAETGTAGYAVDMLSNGVKFRMYGSSSNQSGYTYIYAAWAEAPTFNLYGAQSNAR